MECFICVITFYSQTAMNFSLLQLFDRGMKVKVAQSCLTLCDPMDYTVQGQNIG